MKFFYIPYIVLAIILITQLIIFMPNSTNVTQNNTDHQVTNNDNLINDEKKDISKKDYLYEIKSKNDKVYLFDNKNNIIDILEIEYKNLRNFDKAQIDSGIKINTKEDIYYFIEDFTS